MSYYSIKYWDSSEPIPCQGTLQYPEHFNWRYLGHPKSNYNWTSHNCDSPCLCLIDGSNDTYLRGIKYDRKDARPWDLKGINEDDSITEETMDEYVKLCNLTVNSIYISNRKDCIYEIIDVNTFKHRNGEQLTMLIYFKKPHPVPPKLLK